MEAKLKIRKVCKNGNGSLIQSYSLPQQFHESRYVIAYKLLRDLCVRLYHSIIIKVV